MRITEGGSIIAGRMACCMLHLVLLVGSGTVLLYKMIGFRLRLINVALL